MHIHSAACGSSIIPQVLLALYPGVFSTWVMDAVWDTRWRPDPFTATFKLRLSPKQSPHHCCRPSPIMASEHYSIHDTALNLPNQRDFMRLWKKVTGICTVCIPAPRGFWVEKGGKDNKVFFYVCVYVWCRVRFGLPPKTLEFTPCVCVCGSPCIPLVPEGTGRFSSRHYPCCIHTRTDAHTHTHQPPEKPQLIKVSEGIRGWIFMRLRVWACMIKSGDRSEVSVDWKDVYVVINKRRDLRDRKKCVFIQVFIPPCTWWLSITFWVSFTRPSAGMCVSWQYVQIHCFHVFWLAGHGVAKRSPITAHKSLPNVTIINATQYPTSWQTRQRSDMVTAALTVGRTKTSGHYSSRQEADEPLKTTGHSLRHHWPFTCAAISAPCLVKKPLGEALNEEICRTNAHWQWRFRY